MHRWAENIQNPPPTGMLTKVGLFMKVSVNQELPGTRLYIQLSIFIS